MCLPKEVSLKSAITQWSNVGGLISGLYTSDYDLIGRSLQDVIVEPVRKKLIPHFDAVKNAAINSGALGAGISGAGPTIFALSKSEVTAKNVLKNMQSTYENTGIDFSIFNSKISTQGVRIVNSE